MAQALYKVVLSGETHDDFDKDDVIQELATLFKCPQDKAAGLLAGKPTKLKKEMLQDIAEKYCARLDKAGVKCGIESIEKPQLSAGLSLESTDIPKAKPNELSLEKTDEPAADNSSDLLSGTSLSLEPVSANAEPEQVSIEKIPSSIQPVTEQAVEPGNMVCPKCQTKQAQAEQCTKCGIFIQKYLAQQNAENSVKETSNENTNDQAEDDDDIDDMQDYELFVGDTFDDKYRLRFSEIRDNDDKYAQDWNWAAFLVAVPWMIHRKMYLFAAAYFLIGFIVPGWLSLVMSISMGLFGTFLYYRFAQYRIGKATGSGIDRANDIVAMGGVLPIPVVIGISIAGSVLFSVLYYSIYLGPTVMNSTNDISNDLAGFDETVNKSAAMGIVSLKAAINMHISFSPTDFNSNDLPASASELQEKYKIPPELFYDFWKTEIEYQTINLGYSLRSAGPDLEFNTEDDLVVKSVFDQ